MEKKELYDWAIINGEDFVRGSLLATNDENAKMKAIAQHKDIIGEDTEVKVVRPFC